MLGVHTQTKRILCISDQPELRRIVEDLFDVDSSSILIEAASEEEGVEMACSIHPDLVMIDTGLHGCGGLYTARKIRDRWPQVKVIMVGNYVTEHQPVWS